MGQRFKEPRLLVFPPLPEEIPLVGRCSDNFRFCQAVEVQDGGRGLPSGTAGRSEGEASCGAEGPAPGYRRSTAAPYGAAFSTVEVNAICFKPARLSARRRVLDIPPSRGPRSPAASSAHVEGSGVPGAPALGELLMPGVVRIEHAPRSALLRSIEK